MKRRHFLQKAGLTSMLIGTGTFPLQAIGSSDIQQLTILHTNDVHSRIDPFPMDGVRNACRGGAARRAALIDRIRGEEEQVLLLDAGDIFQGTPYFNFFNGELEFKLMSMMKYDAATIGNHDFDAGLDGLYKQLPHAKFPLVISNYDLSDTIMHDQTKPFMIFEKGEIRIGVFGIGIELDGLVPPKLFKGVRYLDPIKHANSTAAHLKKEQSCDYVICLSHLGFKYDSEKVSDHDLAKASKNIDLILGGHTHTFLERPVQVANARGRAVTINQVGFGGIMLGRLDVYFEKRRKRFRSKGTGILIKGVQ